VLLRNTLFQGKKIEKLEKNLKKDIEK